VFPGIIYTPDFKITYSDGRTEIEEIKGHSIADFRPRAKMFLHPDLPLILIRSGVR
jgi:hypothetical protein